MKHENDHTAKWRHGLKRREFVAVLAGCTASLMVSGLFPGDDKMAAATASPSDRLGRLLPLRKLGASGAVVTNLGVGGDHVGSASEFRGHGVPGTILNWFSWAPFFAASEYGFGRGPGSRAL